MQTNKWGPHMWKSLETIAHNYDPHKHNRKSYKLLFTDVLADTLPCIHCRNSYKQFITEIPLTDKHLQSRKGLTTWLYQIHCKVNHKLRNQGLLDKPDPSYISVCKKYDTWRADCSKKQGLAPTCRMPNTETRCKATTARGKQCSRKKVKGCKGCCTQHTKNKPKRKYSRKKQK
jgi:hypothetical protein